MAISNATQTMAVSQPASIINRAARRQEGALETDKILMLINIVEVLPILSGSIIHDTQEGEPYEVLVRRLEGLHANIVELAELAAVSKLSLDSLIEV